MLFLAAYVAMAAFVRFDAGHRRGAAMTPWLDAVIVCGGAGALAAVLLLTPFVQAFPQGGVPLMIALIYPVINVVLALVVVGQWALAARPMSRRDVTLVGGFLLMAFAESSLILKLSTGPYQFSMTVIVLWGSALLLLVGAACSPRPPQATLARRLPAWFLAVSFLLAIILLVARPQGTVGVAVAIPAVITLLATSLRLTIALKESRESTENYRLAVTDDLTGLPNRRALMMELDRRLPGEAPVSLVLFDLDGFKEVNDTLGHGAGDTLLELVGLRVREVLPANLAFARVGGDEFAVICSTSDEIELMELASLIRQTLLARARVDDLDLAVDASIGIAIRDAEVSNAVDLLRRADVAMYEAKTNRSGAQVYSADRDEFSRQRLQLNDELRKALDRQQIQVWYQPKVSARTDAVVGVEALVRWEHPDRGLLSPISFLAAARRAGLMQQMSEVIIEQAVNDSARWRAAGLNLSVAINIAPSELLTEALMPLVYRALVRTGVPADSITVEVTEDTFLNDPERARELLQDIRAHGVRTSVDDYGTGFSSLAYLRDLPLNELKMDRSFVAGVLADPRSHTIVRSTIDMAHALDLVVVAEGVESTHVAEAVTAMGVDVLQGYAIAPPMHPDDLLAWALMRRRPVIRPL
jgi:diguanylate cyclase (GGDEF)-like protein